MKGAALEMPDVLLEVEFGAPFSERPPTSEEATAEKPGRWPETESPQRLQPKRAMR